MVLAGIFAGLGIVVVGFLFLCWKVYWFWVQRMRDVASLLHRPGLRPLENLQQLFIRQEECCDQEEAWHKRYHWCLLLLSIFFGFAAFCAVLTLTGGLPFWIHIPLAAVGGAVALLGFGYLGYGVVREKILPLDDVIMEEE